MYRLLSHPVFLSAIFGWFMAQFVKAAVELFKPRSLKSRDVIYSLLWRTGGMPSSHSSTTAALTTSLGFVEGMDSPIFISMLFFSMLVIRDALGVRRSAGLQARALNNLGAELQKRYKIPFHPVKEVHGHTPAEVFIGALLGFFIAVAFCKL
ncbi:divergent PAP2 family protein [Marispirochaeta aestuarii]|uniref:divergent PAP2 family protein n=1 Tax=Marispirochaeta aestuarii TaxID=1963862 RepID=UPI0029C77535|nr:divergent PAP2 family protein [Marispirochaeta aestuarii]